MSEREITRPLDTWSQESFLPEDYVKSKGERRANLLSLTLFGVMMLAVVAAFFATNRRWMSVRSEQRSINAMYVREAEKIEELKALESQRAEMISKAEVTAALVERVPRSVLFAQIVQRMPRNVTLLDLELKSEEIKTGSNKGHRSSRSGGVRTLTGVGSSTGSKAEEKKDENKIQVPQYNQSLTLAGVALTNGDIADYIENLKACSLLDRVELQYIKEVTMDNEVLRKFELSCMIRKGADARSLVEPVVPLEMPDVPSPNELTPPKPLVLPPSVPVDDVEAATPGAETSPAAGAGEITLNVPTMPSLPGARFSNSAFGSPKGIFGLMASASRTGERVRSEKAAKAMVAEPEAESLDEDLPPAPTLDPEEPEIPASLAVPTEDEADGTEPKADAEEPIRMWFDVPVKEEASEDDPSESEEKSGDSDEGSSSDEDASGGDS
ncbi:MAG TPA: hypothetical protein ENJ00_06405 [Phycisphaerales bacterium]|nr:hypothetical protein [Phycisphaerales bacterium]